MSQTKKKGAAAVSDALCALYENNGYTQYVMSKFEAYDLYVRNKDFLISDSVITFTDTNGRLLALKPDVTLSIVKNSKDVPHYVQKVYYQENVYRISKGTRSFCELPQTGLECMGEVDAYCLFDVIRLACLSLAAIGDDYVLDLSHLTPVGALFARLDLPQQTRTALEKEKRKSREEEKKARELKDRLKAMEQEIARAEEEAGRLERELADPETWKDPDAAAETTRRYNALKAETERLYEQYDELDSMI